MWTLLHIQISTTAIYMIGENPMINTYTYGAEIAEDVLVIGSKPGILVTRPRFIFSCLDSYLSRRLAKGVTCIELRSDFSITSLYNSNSL